MLKIIKTKGIDDNTKTMGEMEPLEVAMVSNPTSSEFGHIVMRTANADVLEVLDLSSPGKDACWTEAESDTQIKSLKPGESVIVEFFNT